MVNGPPLGSEISSRNIPYSAHKLSNNLFIQLFLCSGLPSLTQPWPTTSLIQPWWYLPPTGLVGILSDQLPPFGQVNTLQDARSHDIHEDRDNGEWCAMPLCHGLSSLLTLHNIM